MKDTQQQQYQPIEVPSFPITVVQFLKWNTLVMTGGEAKEWVRQGFVLLNGEYCLIPGKQLQQGDRLQIQIMEDDGQTNLCYELKKVE